MQTRSDPGDPGLLRRLRYRRQRLTVSCGIFGEMPLTKYVFSGED